jgi:hypothetical protein
MSRTLLLIAAGALALGAQTPVGGPSLGFVFDARGQALRPILGIAGASRLGDAMQSPAPLSKAAFSLQQNVAIVNDGAWKAVGLTASASDPVVLPDGLTAGSRLVVSATGTAAAFYDSDNNALTVVTGIGSDSMASNAVALDSLPGPITAMAAGDDGALLVSASAGDGTESLIWIGSDGSTRQLASLQKTAALLLWNKGANALAVDRGANQVWNIQDPGGNAAVTLVASDADGVSSPAGAVLSADGKQLWVANGNRTLLGVDITTRSSVSLTCGFDLTTILPTTDGAVFRLNDLDSGPLWMLDTTPGADPHLVFVPGLPPVATDEEDAQ